MLVKCDLLHRFQVTLFRDRTLRDAIQKLALTPIESGGYELSIDTYDDGFKVVSQKLIWITRAAIAFAPVVIIRINHTALSIESIQSISQAARIPMQGINDRKLKVEQRRQSRQLLEAAIEALVQDYDVFFMSPDGRYEDVRLQPGSGAPPIAAHQVLGKTVHDVLDDFEADTVMECLLRARLTNQPQECLYELNRRRYHGRAFPAGREERIMLFLARRVG